MKTTFIRFMVGFDFIAAGLGYGTLLGTGQFRLGLFVLASLNLLFGMHELSKLTHVDSVLEDRNVQPPAA